MSEDLFYQLLRAESEKEVLDVLRRRNLLDDPANWQNLGNEENNFSIVGNQHADSTGALVEKIINAIDASLMGACFSAGIDPESLEAPQTMADAVERFFGVRQGRIGELLNRDRMALANAIQLVAVGSRDDPCYLIVDHGEGQTPENFAGTFLSLAKSNKLRIPFVQGKFNSGGTGVLQFCGSENLQLIASRRHPDAPTSADDDTKDQWGYTLVRRIEPPESDRRRSSVYVYLAPNGRVPSFRSDSVLALPGDSRPNQPGQPYTAPLSHGSIIKLYNYRWRTKSLATTDARFEVEKYLHSPCLPFRITETRSSYRANYYSTTVSGVWAAINANGAEESQRVEEGFPASATLNLESIGPLPYRIAVFREDVDPRRVPHGVFFSVNGQVHGGLPPDFVSRRLEFEYLRNHLLVSVDCTAMRNRVREDFFMASRDRLRQNEIYDEILSALYSDLKDHRGLKALNAARRAKALEKALGDQEDIVHVFQDLLKLDPALRSLLNIGDRLVTRVGPTEVERFDGKRFPTFFQIVGNPKVPPLKICPINRTCRVDFETDAVNDYFDRADSPGEIIIKPLTALEYNHLWNGIYSTRFRPPSGASVGDRFNVSIAVTDPDRASRGHQPFLCDFTLQVVKQDNTTSRSGGTSRPSGPRDGDKEAPRLAIPNVIEVREDDWAKYDPPFTSYDALRVMRDGQGGYDYHVNMDNAYLLTEVKQAKELDKKLVVYWFKWGLALCALGSIQHVMRLSQVRTGSSQTAAELVADDVVEVINRSMGGVASVIVPVIRTLHRGPEAA